MLSNPMLDVAIGLIFLYLLLSIVVTVLQEFIASTLKLRNKNLSTAIVELVGNDNKAAFFKHPLIYPLFRGGFDPNGDPARGGPAYIPKRNFALAILDLYGRGKMAATTQPSAPAFALAAFFEDADSGVGLSQRMTKFGSTATEVIEKIANETVRTAATNALTAAVGELKTATDVVDTAVKELENLFDSTMDRASGWYKVNAQRIALVIGVLVALALNADSLHVGKQLWENEELRTRAVAAADTYYTSAGGQKQLTAMCLSEATKQPVAATAEATDASGEALDLVTWQLVKDCTERELNEAATELAEVGYPIGWTGWDGLLPKGQPGQNPVWALVGIFITGLALSLGASFWFDLLGKFMNVRMTGKREVTGTQGMQPNVLQ